MNKDNYTKFEQCSVNGIHLPEEVELLHETLLLPLQSFSYSIHFP